MKWFGEPWGAPICTEYRRVDTPVEMACTQCLTEILPDSQGVMLPCGAISPPEVQTYKRTAMDEVRLFHGVPFIAYHLNCFLEVIGVRHPKVGKPQPKGKP